MMAQPTPPLSPKLRTDAFTRALDAQLRRSSVQETRRNSYGKPQPSLAHEVVMSSYAHNVDAPTPVNTLINNGRRPSIGGIGSPTFNLALTNGLLGLQSGSGGFQPSLGLGVGRIGGTLSSTMNVNTPATFIGLNHMVRSSVQNQGSLLGLLDEEGNALQFQPQVPLSPASHLHGQVIDSSPVCKGGISSFRISNGDAAREFPTYFGMFSDVPKGIETNEGQPEHATQAKTDKVKDDSKDQNIFG